MSTESRYSSVVRGYAAFLAATYGDTGTIDRPAIWFDIDDIITYMSTWVRQGFTARTLKGNITALRGFARRHGIAFPPLGSDDHLLMNDMRQALLKIDPTVAAHATIVDLFYIEYVILAIGISSSHDFWTCSHGTLIFVARLLVCHACGMRACEHDHGCRLSDVRSADCSASGTPLSGYVMFAVGDRIAGEPTTSSGAPAQQEAQAQSRPRMYPSRLGFAPFSWCRTACAAAPRPRRLG